MKPTHLILIASLITAAGCRDRIIQMPAQPASAPTDVDPNVVMRTYDVPAGSGDRISGMLGGLFANIGDKVPAKATVSPNGQLIVVANDGIQQGVVTLLDKMSKSEPPPPPPTVKLSYWLVLGRAAKERKDGQGLGDITKALDAISASEGPMEFVRHDHLEVVTATDHHSFSSGMHTEASQMVSVVDHSISASLEIKPKMAGSVLETRVQLAPGQLLVLGAVGVNPKSWPPDFRIDDSDVTLFYVVRATIQDA